MVLLAVLFVAPKAWAAPIQAGQPGVAVFGADQNEAGKALPKPAADTAPATPKPAYLQENQPLQLKDYDEPKAQPQSPWWQQLLGFLLKLVLVLGLVLLTLAAIKKLNGGRLALPNTKGRNLMVLESTHLTPQQAVHIICLGGDRLLVVGATPQSLTPLAEITDPLMVRHYMASSKVSASQFNQMYDLESVVQEHGEFLDESRGKRRKGWPRA